MPDVRRTVSAVDSSSRAIARCAGIAAVLISCMACQVQAQVEPDAVVRSIDRITITDLKRHCSTLASDALEGREAGSRGGQAAAAYVQSELRKIAGIKPVNSAGWTQEFGANYRNIIAILPGSDPALRHEIIIVGAHYDHVGRGTQANSSGPVGYIHNGADDNASGTAALLTLADAFASLKTSPRRTLMFAFWDAEEVGLLGSKHWIANPTMPLKDVRMVVNIDMVGRLREGNLLVVGWRSAPGWRRRLVRHNPAGDLDYQFEPKVIADSDHHPFYAAGIPALHIDSGKHDDYHRPSDDADKLNYPGIRRLARLIFDLVEEAANDDQLPAFRREALTEPAPAWLTANPQTVAPARLGVTFDQKQFEANRAVIQQVTPGTPAAKAGLKAGDRLLNLAHWNQGTAAELKAAIRVAQNPVAVRIERPGLSQQLELKLELAGEPVRIGFRWVRDATIPDGVVISQVTADSPADLAAIKVGHVLMQVDGEDIGSDDDLRTRLLNNPNPVHLKVERNGRVKELLLERFDPPTP